VIALTVIDPFSLYFDPSAYCCFYLDCSHLGVAVGWGNLGKII
jgi:hypothetical protein